MALTDMQREYLDNCRHRWNVKTGATGSGKSFVDYAVTIPKRVIACRGEGLIVLLGNTRGTLERNVLSPMRTLWGERLVGMIRSDNTVRLFGKNAYALGADNKKHVARIQGATIEYAYGDEVTTWSRDVFEMLKSRLRCEHSHFDGTCNPDGPKHWFKKFLDSDADIYYQHYTIDDNPELPAAFVAALKQEHAGSVYYDRYILGLWAAAEGAIYRPWIQGSAAMTRTVPRGELCYSAIGVDFGGNESAHAFVLVGFLKGWRGVCVLREYYRREIITPNALETDFVAFASACRQDYGTTEVRCDSAEQVLISGLDAACMRAGLPMDICNARKGEINDRIRFTLRMMGRGAFFVDAVCTHIRDALSEAVWDAKSPVRDRRLDDGTTNIDSLDAMEYALEPYMDDITAISAANGGQAYESDSQLPDRAGLYASQ